MCANKRMPIETSKNIEKSEFYEMEAETFYFLVFFWFDDKIVIKRKTSDIRMGETVPYNIKLSKNVKAMFFSK